MTLTLERTQIAENWHTR